MRTLLLFALLLPLNAAVTVYTVCASGCTYSNTALQTAMDAAVTAQGSVCAPVVLILTAGETFTAPSGGFQMAAKTCAQYITVRSTRLGELPAGVRVGPAQVALMAKLISAPGDTSSTIATIIGETTSYWRYEGLEITMPVLGSLKNNLVYLGSGYLPPEDTYAGVSHHFIFDRNYMHGLANEDGPLRCIFLNAHHVEITNNYISECKAVGADSQAIGSIQAFGPTLVQNNYLSAAGEIFQAGGSGRVGCTTDCGLSFIAVPGMSQRNMQWIGNYFYKKPEWRVNEGLGSGACTANAGVPTRVCMVGEYEQNSSGGQWYQCTAAPSTWSTTGTVPKCFVVKNMWEAKDGQGFEIFGNVFRYSWEAGQGGNAFLFNQSPPAPRMEIQKVRIRANWMDNINVGPAMGNLGYAAVPPLATNDTVIRNVAFEDNLWTNIGGPYLQGDTLNLHRFFVLNRASDIIFRHNTLHFYTGYGSLSLLINGSGDSPNTPVIGGQNLWYDNIFDQHLAGGYSWNLGTGGSDSHCTFRNVATGFGGASDVRKNVFINTGTTGDSCTGGTGSVFPADSVQYADIGDVLEDPAGGNYTVQTSATAAKGGATDGLDIGYRADILGWATAGAESGAANPYLDMQWRAVKPTADGAVIQFTAYSTAACTWLAATSRTMASPAGSTGQSRVGRSGVATITGLTTKTKYWVRQTCDGGRYIDGEIVTL